MLCIHSHYSIQIIPAAGYQNPFLPSKRKPTCVHIFSLRPTRVHCSQRLSVVIKLTKSAPHMSSTLGNFTDLPFLSIAGPDHQGLISLLTLPITGWQPYVSILLALCGLLQILVRYWCHAPSLHSALMPRLLCPSLLSDASVLSGAPSPPLPIPTRILIL